MTDAPENIDTHVDMIEALIEGRLKPGGRVHVSVCGQMTEDAFFEGYRDQQIFIRIGNITHVLSWGDIQELWPVSLADVAKARAASSDA
jgi:hypothetical protein